MIRATILTVSDRAAQGERPDASGPALVEVAQSQGWAVVDTGVVPDDADLIEAALLAWCARGDVDLILTIGGTGVAPRDVTPEATLRVIQRPVPGLAEAMRAASLKITPHAMLSRAVVGTREKTLIVNLPGSPKGALENLQVILPVLPHVVELLQDSPSAEQGHNTQF